jgi:hypothetical protein
MSVDASHSGPWYRHFWPWFIVVLLGTTVVAGISTVVIAFRGADSLVTDDYYRTGKSINRVLAEDREATRREANARVSIDEFVVVGLDILGDAPAALELELSHVTRAELDLRLRLDRGADGRYVSSEPLPPGHYYATLRPVEAGEAWRLRRRIAVPFDRSFSLEPGG